MKCFNKVILGKLIFSVKVLMKCSHKDVECFLCLLIIIKNQSEINMTKKNKFLSKLGI